MAEDGKRRPTAGYHDIPTRINSPLMYLVPRSELRTLQPIPAPLDCDGHKPTGAAFRPHGVAHPTANPQQVRHPRAHQLRESVPSWPGLVDAPRLPRKFRVDSCESMETKFGGSAERGPMLLKSIKVRAFNADTQTAAPFDEPDDREWAQQHRQTASSVNSFFSGRHDCARSPRRRHAQQGRR